MSVRRLADEAVQPATFAFSNDNAKWAEKKIAEYPAGRQQSAVIPLLMRAQDQDGWISRPAIEKIAEMLGMAYIRVLEVATFYTQFQLKPVGTRAHIQVCGTTPCMLRGAEALREVCQHKIHHDPFHANAEGTLSWEEVECMGACVNAPMVAIGHDTYEDLTPARLEEIVDAFAAGKGDTITPGPQNGRTYSASIAGQTTLLEEPTKERARVETPPPAPANPAPVVPPTPAPPPAAAAKDQEPTTPGRKRTIPAEAAPALKEPKRAPKAAVEAVEKERDKLYGTTGEAAKAMRPDATGSESPASKIDAGKAPGKPHRSAPGEGAASAGTAPDEPAKPAKPARASRAKKPVE